MRRTAELHAAAEQQQLAGMMVERLGVHGADQAEVVGAGWRCSGMKSENSMPLALAGLNDSRAGEHRGGRLDEGELQVLGQSKAAATGRSTS